MPLKRVCLYLLILVLVPAGAACIAASESVVCNDEGRPFSEETVARLARHLAREPYQESGKAPERLTQMDYATYCKINFQQNAAIRVQFRRELARSPSPETAPALRQLVGNPLLGAWHLAQLPRPSGQKPVFHAPAVTAEWKLHHAKSLEELEIWLEADETLALLAQPECIEAIQGKARKTAGGRA